MLQPHKLIDKESCYETEQKIFDEFIGFCDAALMRRGSHSKVSTTTSRAVSRSIMTAAIRVQ